MRLIDAGELLEEVTKNEEELLAEKEIAKENEDTELLLAINNQLSALFRVKAKINSIHIAYDVDKVVEQLEDMEELCNECGNIAGLDMAKKAIKIVKEGGEHE